MESKYKISIPKPCHEDWGKMTPDSTGKFCGSCAKSVVDFTNMSATEVQNYFIENRGKNLCGRFKTKQLDSIVIQIPRATLFSPMQFHSMFMLALLIAMGTTLFSCQNNNGEKQKIDGVEVVDSNENKTTVGVLLPPKIIDSTPNNENIMVVEIDMRKYDSLVKAGAKLPPPPPKKDQVKFTKIITTGEILFKTDTVIKEVYEDNNIYGSVGIEVFPDSKGGIQKFYTFFTEEYKIPRKAKKLNGKINLSFIVEKDGSLNEFKIINDLGYGTGEEAIRVLKLSPKFYPGEKNGKKNRTQFHLPFIINKDTIFNENRKSIIKTKITSIDLVRDSIISEKK